MKEREKEIDDVEEAVVKKRRISLGWGLGEDKGHRVCKRGKRAKGSDAVTTITHLRGG